MENIGIDLGTSNSSGGICKSLNNIILSPICPSVVLYYQNEFLVGQEALIKYRQLEQNKIKDFTFIREVKRLMGQNYSEDLNNEIQGYEIIKSATGKVKIKLHNNKTVSPEEISSLILKQVIKDLNLKTKNINSVTITVPAYFNISSIDATKTAAKLAGLNNISILQEPIASALAMGKYSENQKFLIYDIGGGTLDISLIELKNNEFKVLQHSGNMHLGGVDFDKALFRYFLNIFNRLNNVNLTPECLDKDSILALMKECERCKMAFNNQNTNKVNIFIPRFYNEKSFYATIEREIFDELISNIINLCVAPVQEIFGQLTTQTNLNNFEVIMVGGCSQLVSLQEQLKQYFNKFNIKVSLCENPMFAIAVGAAINAYFKEGGEIKNGFTIINKTSLSIGVEVMNEFMSILIPKNTVMPYTAKADFTNYEKSEQMVIKIFQGEREFTKDNFFIDNLIIPVTPEEPGSHKIRVYLTVNIDGTIKVTVTDLINSRSISKIIMSNMQFTDEEVSRLIAEQDEFKARDLNNKKIRSLQLQLKVLLERFDYLNTQIKISQELQDYFNKIKNDYLNYDKYLLKKAVHDVNEELMLIIPVESKELTGNDPTNQHGINLLDNTKETDINLKYQIREFDIKRKELKIKIEELLEIVCKPEHKNKLQKLYDVILTKKLDTYKANDLMNIENELSQICFDIFGNSKIEMSNIDKLHLMIMNIKETIKAEFTNVLPESFNNTNYETLIKTVKEAEEFISNISSVTNEINYYCTEYIKKINSLLSVLTV